MKDWIGDSKSVFRTIGAHGTDREDNDYYATDPSVIDALVNNFPLPMRIWECACGEGHLSKRLAELGHIVYSSDKIDRGFGEARDFLTSPMPEGYQAIVTNPPFRYVTEFIEHALDILPIGGVLALFLKTTYLEGQERYKRIYSKRPPKLLLQFVKRQRVGKNGVFVGTGAQAYAWYIWRKGQNLETKIRWV